MIVALGLRIALLVGCFAIASHASGEDWPQWRGPQRNGIASGSLSIDAWPEADSPKVAWRAAVGKGHSAVSIADGRAYTMGWDGTADTVFCFEAATGKPIWKQSYPCKTILQWPGPRATPTIHDGVAYTLGQHGQLRAWNAKTGEPRWQRDLPEEYNPDVDYGFVWSPLVVGELLILNAGSRGLAIRARDGSIAWGDDGKKGACVSAVPYTHEGRQCVLVISITDDRNEANLVGVDPESGRELWRFNGWKEKWGAMAVDPVIRESRVFLTSAQEFRRAARFTIADTTLREDWSTERVAGYTGAAVLIREHLYLVDDKGILRCLDWNTGREQWTQRGFDVRGTLIAADGKLLVQTGASGKLVLAVADPKRYQKLREATVFTEKPETYTAPVLANGRIYCRSYEGEVVCVDVR
jgi:outer membrane protein assembly factor BamB